MAPRPPHRIAVTVSGHEVSPVFETAQQLLLVDLAENGDELGDRTRVRITDLELGQRVGHLTDLGVRTLLCGGITGFIRHALVERGIDVFSWLSGDVDEILAQTAHRIDSSKVRLRTVAVAADGPDVERAAVVIFGRCSHFALFAKNLATKATRAPSGAGGWLARTSLLQRRDVGVLITLGCGPNAIGALEAAGIEVVTGFEGTAAAAIRWFRQRARETQ